MATFQHLLGVSTTAAISPARDAAGDVSQPAPAAPVSSEAGFVSPSSLGNFAFLASAVNIIWLFLGNQSETLKSEWCALAIAGIVGIAIYVSNLKTQQGDTTPWPTQLIIAVVNVFLLAAVAVGIESQI